MCILIFYPSFLPKKLFALYSWLSLITAALKFAICVLWDDLQFQKTKKELRMEGKTSSNFPWKGRLGEEQWLRTLSLVDWMAELSWPQILVPMPFLFGLSYMRRPWCQLSCLNEKMLEEETPVLGQSWWFWWLSMYVLCLLLMWPHVGKNFSIYTHAQGFKCENDHSLDHSAEIHFNSNTFKLTLDLYSLWHNVIIFYEGKKKYIFLPTPSYCLTWSICIHTGLQYECISFNSFLSFFPFFYLRHVKQTCSHTQANPLFTRLIYSLQPCHYSGGKLIAIFTFPQFSLSIPTRSAELSPSLSSLTNRAVLCYDFVVMETNRYCIGLVVLCIQI